MLFGEKAVKPETTVQNEFLTFLSKKPMEEGKMEDHQPARNLYLSAWHHWIFLSRCQESFWLCLWWQNQIFWVRTGLFSNHNQVVFAAEPIRSISTASSQHITENWTWRNVVSTYLWFDVWHSDNITAGCSWNAGRPALCLPLSNGGTEHQTFTMTLT